MINPMRSQPTRMMGLASGMDTDFIIQQTLRMHQFKIDNQLRNRRIIEWRQQTHNSIRDDIQNLRSTFLSTQGSKTMMTRNTFNATKATMSGMSSSAVSIRTNAGSPLGNFSINSVTQMARGAHLTTASGISANNNGFATTTRLGDMRFENNGSGDSISWTHTGGTVRVGNEDIKIERTNGGAWSFSGRAGVDIEVNGGDGYNGTGPLTLKVGDTTRTLNWDEANSKFTEDRQGVFTHAFNIPADTDKNHPVRNFTLTATQANDGKWNLSSSAGTVVREGDDGEELFIRFGTGDNEQKIYLGKWDDANNSILPDGSESFIQSNTTFDQATRDVVTMVGEARLTFNSGGDDVSVLIRATDTLGDMMTRVNNQAGVSMTYDRLTDQFTLQARTGNTINPAGTHLGIFSESNFFNIIRGDVSKIALADGETGSASVVRGGQQAEAWINGERVLSNTNTFDYRGVTITLHNTFNVSNRPLTAEEKAELNMTPAQIEAHDAAVRAGSVNVNLARDTEPAMKAIREFIDSYNAIIKRLEDLLSERKTGSEVSYRPLTDEEKQGMTDRQVEEWEAIARKGILRNDQGIQNLVSNLRRSFFEEIEGMGVSASQIGLTTGSHLTDRTGGQIIINEDRLRAALERDPDMVADIFVRIDSSGTAPRGVGLMHRIDGLMRDYVNVSQTTSTRNLEQSLKRVNEQIERMEARMFAEEDRLYRIFASMESSMQRLQQQGSFFNSMLGM